MVGVARLSAPVLVLAGVLALRPAQPVRAGIFLVPRTVRAVVLAVLELRQPTLLSTAVLLAVLATAKTPTPRVVLLRVVMARPATALSGVVRPVAVLAVLRPLPRLGAMVAAAMPSPMVLAVVAGVPAKPSRVVMVVLAEMAGVRSSPTAIPEESCVMPAVTKSLVCNGVVVNSILIDPENTTFVPPEGCFLGDPTEYPYVPEEWPITTPEAPPSE